MLKVNYAWGATVWYSWYTTFVYIYAYIRIFINKYAIKPTMCASLHIGLYITICYGPGYNIVFISNVILHTYSRLV